MYLRVQFKRLRIHTYPKRIFHFNCSEFFWKLKRNDFAPYIRNTRLHYRLPVVITAIKPLTSTTFPRIISPWNFWQVSCHNIIFFQLRAILWRKGQLRDLQEFANLLRGSHINNVIGEKNGKKTVQIANNRKSKELKINVKLLKLLRSNNQSFAII